MPAGLQGYSGEHTDRLSPAFMELTIKGGDRQERTTVNLEKAWERVNTMGYNLECRIVTPRKGSETGTNSPERGQDRQAGRGPNAGSTGLECVQNGEKREAFGQLSGSGVPPSPFVLPATLSTSLFSLKAFRSPLC